MDDETTLARTPLRHVVAATDFSTAAGAGVAWARDVARLHRAQLHLVHAVCQLDPALLGTEVPPDLAEAALGAGRRRLEELAGELDTDEAPARTWVDVGQPSQVIRRVADRVGADLLVLATRGLGGFRRLLLGSTAERVVQHGEQPVLSVHASDGPAARPVRRVLLPTDFSADAGLAHGAARRIFRLGPGCHVHLLHTFRLPPEYQVYRAEGLSAMSRRLLDGALANYRRELDRMAGELGDQGLEVATEVAEGDAAEVIVERAAELGADLVAMGTYGRSALGRAVMGSVARRVVQHAPCPVLTVHGRS